MKTTKKRITTLVSVACAGLMLVGSFAFFTDRVEETATGTAGNIDLVFTDASKADVNTAGDSQTNDQDNVWTNGIVKAGDVMNPGDSYDMSYTLSNDGSKSIDVKQQFIITSDEAMTEGATEYNITVNGKTLTPTLSADGKTLTYEMTEYDVLAGDVEADGEEFITYNTKLAFELAAKNKFMDNNITVALNVWAKQHRNTNNAADWENIATFETVNA